MIKFVNDVYYVLKEQKVLPVIGDKLRLELFIYPPDEKRRDIDNLCKAILDALQYCGVYSDDFKICQLYVERCEVRRYGQVEFVLRGIE